MPRWAPSRMTSNSISPRPAYSTMLRAISEMAVATTVRSLPVKPTCSASSRPRCRAVRMSCSDPIGRRSSSLIGRPFPALLEKCQPFLQVEAGGHAVEPEAQLDHGERNVRFEPHDDGVRSPQPSHLSDVEQRADG